MNGEATPPTAAATLRVTALLFAQYRSDAGIEAIDLELPTGATVRSAARALERELAGSLSLTGAMAAVNERYARPDSVLADGDRVAFLPPVSGG